MTKQSHTRHRYYNGLTDAQVATRITRGQTNAFTQESSRSTWSIIRANTLTLFNGIIAAAFIILLVIGRWQDALFGFSALANAIIGSIQEFRAKRALDKLALLNAPYARVKRNGTEKEMALAEIVLNDLVILRAGDQVPADATVLITAGLQLDESMLTGESDPIDKNIGDEVLSGSVVLAGSGSVTVDKVGADAFANRFVSEARRFSLMASELHGAINTVLRWVTWIIGPIIILVFNSQIVALGGWSQVSATWQDAAVSTIASVVAMIPLGLVLMTSISFVVGAVRLARQNVLVQELPAIEGLARIDIVCLDKTGTLTEGTIAFDKTHVIDKTIKGDWQQALAWYSVQPDANATALCLATKFPDVPDQTPAAQVAFSSVHKWSAVSFTDKPVAGSWVLGGPEIVFASTKHGLALDQYERLMQQVDKLTHQGLRTLVLAHSPHMLDANVKTLPRELIPVTLLTFKEQVREDAKETLGYFASQGVGVRIISGDNPDTVAAIARQVGLDVPSGFDARQLPDNDEALAQILEKTIVFGRVTPEQKRRMIAILQQNGHVVAMIGDGINDTLAMKSADIGIAMNTASAATKAVARIVLLDGKFSHLPHVVSEGRRVIANIERVSMLFLSKTAYAVGLAVMFGAMMSPFPFLPRQLSIIDGLTIGIPAFLLALLPNAQRYQPGFLKRSLSFAVPVGFVVTMALTAYSGLATNLGIDVVELRSGSMLLLTIIGLWILIVLSRPVMLLKTSVIGAMMIGLILLYASPIARDFLELTDIQLRTTSLIIVISFVAILAIEIIRFIHRRIFTKEMPTIVRKHRPPVVTLIVVLTYISAFISILSGIIIVLSRYFPELNSDVTRSFVTIAGAVVILFGCLVISVASGLARGDRAGYIILTVILVLTVAISMLSAVITPGERWDSLASVAISGTILAILWTKHVRRYFYANPAHLL